MMLIFRSAECKKYGDIGASIEISKENLGSQAVCSRVGISASSH
jgi:hypothetical protein